MLIAALAVGLLTAYYFGVRPGMVAAGTTVALCLVALVPGLALYAYGAMAVGVFGLLWAGPRMRRKGSPSQLAFLAKLGLARAKRVARDLGIAPKATDRDRDRKRRR
ncbi:MAG TPA: hypothetical protein VMZ28_16655 [Kofleriaceae bacterium]|nr:hypothetical protein [Kofleriaceae bacterium]